MKRLTMLLCLAWSVMLPALLLPQTPFVEDKPKPGCCSPSPEKPGLLAFNTAIADAPKPKQHKGYKPLTPERRKQLHVERRKEHGLRMERIMKAVTPPPSFDAMDQGWCCDPGDQANCVLPWSLV